jgi:hypothetical protein
MADDSRYEAALQTALAVLHALSTRPGMSRPEKLSTVTFIILQAMRQPDHPAAWIGCKPSVN